MLRFTVLAICFVFCAVCTPQAVDAAGGTSQVATTGKKANLNPNWPGGVEKIVNDQSRTDGWNSWFTEWPNDVNQYAMEVESTNDLNRLITNLSKVEGKLRQIRLFNGKAPGSLGWVTNAPKNNSIPVIFSIGDQKRIDEWYGRVRKPFGVMEFLDTPVAVPPTLTLFVQNPKVKLSELKIPDNITVEQGYVPTVFHKSNTKRERDAAKQLRAIPAEAKSIQDKLRKEDAAAQKAIDELLKTRKRASDGKSPEDDSKSRKR